MKKQRNVKLERETVNITFKLHFSFSYTNVFGLKLRDASNNPKQKNCSRERKRFRHSVSNGQSLNEEKEMLKENLCQGFFCSFHAEINLEDIHTKIERERAN